MRHLLNLPFEGAEYDDSFMLADVETNDALPADELQLCPSELGPVAIFPMSATRRRIVATIEQAEGDAPSLDLVRRILRERAPGEFEARALHWSSYFRIHHRHAAQLRVGRIFIAGDAAHIHSPFGGQGMNTGLHDVWNLVWKLDLVLHGHGNEQLLDSYSAERLPGHQEVIETTDIADQGDGHSEPAARRPCATPSSRWCRVWRRSSTPSCSGSRSSASRIRGSPIVEGPGKRYFDDSMRGGNGIGSRFLLVGRTTRPSRDQDGAPRHGDSVATSSSAATLPRPGSPSSGPTATSRSRPSRWATARSPRSARSSSSRSAPDR